MRESPCHLLKLAEVGCEKALVMHVQIHAGESVPPFKTSRGWLFCFCNCYGFRQLFLQGKKLSSDTTLRSSCKTLWRERVLTAMNQACAIGCCLS